MDNFRGSLVASALIVGGLILLIYFVQDMDNDKIAGRMAAGMMLTSAITVGAAGYGRTLLMIIADAMAGVSILMYQLSKDC